MKFFTKREYINEANIIKETAAGTIICNEEGRERRWLCGIKVYDNKWSIGYKDNTADNKPVTGFRK